MSVKTKQQATGADTAPEFFIDGIASIRFMGVNTRYSLYRDISDAAGNSYRQIVLTIVGPTGSIPAVLRQFTAFAASHNMAPRVQDGTR